MKLKTLLGNYPGTQALKEGKVRSDKVELDFADVQVPSSAFKRVVRDLEFDVAELAVITYLIAKAHGKPLVLLPVVVLARFQHPFLIYNSERGTLGPGDLAGKRIGIRSYSVTTSAWLRGMLAADHGVKPESITWVTFEDPHVAEFKDPPNVERASESDDLGKMLAEGRIDAAVGTERGPFDPRFKTIFADPEAAGEDWYRRNKAIQINHMVTVSEKLAKSNPDAVREVYRLLSESRKAAGSAAGPDMMPVGFAANRRNLEVAIDYCHLQGLIPRRYAVEELFDDTTRALN
jgi:4,5-dihydroxyphthalate decarboxylase